MKIVKVKDLADRKTADCLIIPFFEGEKKATLAVKLKKYSSIFQAPIDMKDFSGKERETLFLYVKGEKEKRFMLLGLGKYENMSFETLRNSYGSAVTALLSKKCKTINLLIPDLQKGDREMMLTGIADGLFLSNYGFDQFKTSPTSYTLLQKASIISLAKEEEKIFEKSFLISTGVHMVRDLVNNNADEETPEHLATVARELRDVSNKIKVTIFDKNRIQKEGLGLLYAVGRGASVDPRFIIVEYKGNPSSKEVHAIVGKGITYDTGGLSLKSTGGRGGMQLMKSDMAGAAAVLGTMYTLAKMELPINVTAFVPASENAISSKSYKPGDIYRSYNGLSVEIENTDAEGRLILADALAYAVDTIKPASIIDIASLTGAIVIALGEEIAGLFSNNDEIAKRLHRAGDKTGELVWRMPMYEDYKHDLDSSIADMKNCGSREGSSIIAAFFLKRFIEDTPWAHIDIGGPAYFNKPKRYYPTMGTGFGVRLFVEYFEELINESKL